MSDPILGLLHRDAVDVQLVVERDSAGPLLTPTLLRVLRELFDEDGKDLTADADDAGEPAA